MKILIPLILALLTSGLSADRKASSAQPKVSGTVIMLSNMRTKPRQFVRADDEAVVAKQALPKEHVMRVYYKNGIRSDFARYIATGKIIINFDETKQIDYDVFADKYNVDFTKEINSISKVAVFSVDPSDDVLEKVNEIAADQSETIQYIQPEWIAKVKFR